MSNTNCVKFVLTLPDVRLRIIVPVIFNDHYQGGYCSKYIRLYTITTNVQDLRINNFMLKYAMLMVKSKTINGDWMISSAQIALSHDAWRALSKITGSMTSIVFFAILHMQRFYDKIYAFARITQIVLHDQYIHTRLESCCFSKVNISQLHKIVSICKSIETCIRKSYAKRIVTL